MTKLQPTCTHILHTCTLIKVWTLNKFEENVLEMWVYKENIESFTRVDGQMNGCYNYEVKGDN